jgi:DNA-binding beta-propeller fold protein YncE
MSLRFMFIRISLVIICCFLVLISIAAQSGRGVTTIAGNGTPGFSDQQVNNPYGVVIGPDGGLYFCDLDNQRIRRLNLKTRELTTIAGNGQRGYTGDGGPAIDASFNMPHELRFDKRGDLFIVERDNHVVRKVDMKSRVVTTFAGTGVAGFSGDGGPATKAQLRSPHSIAFDRDGNLLICDVGNHRIRRVTTKTGVIETYAGTGERKPTPDGAPLAGTPLNGPRTIDVDPNGNLYLALREGNAIYRIDPKLERIFLVAGTGQQGYGGDGGPATKATFAGPKGLAYSKDHGLYVVDTENHAIRRIDLKSGVVKTVLGTGEKGNGTETDPLRCKLNRPHGIFVDKNGAVYVGDSEAHRIRVLK